MFFSDMEEDMAKREVWIDNAKGIAILLIIIGHTGFGLTAPVSVLWVFGVHLVMFFLLGGYTLRKKELNTAYLNARFRRLMIPYFLTCMAVLVMDLWNLFYLVHDLSIGSVTGSIVRDLTRSFFASGVLTRVGDTEMGTRIGAIWFLPAMFFATILCQVLLHVTRNITQFGFAAAGLASIAMVSRHYIWLPFSIQSGMLAVFFMWIGYWIRERHHLEKLRWYHYAIAQGVLLWGIFRGYCGADFVTAFLNDVFLSTIVGSSGCLLIYGLSRRIPDSFLAYLGRISLTILCVHLVSLETLGGYVNRILAWTNLTGDVREWMRILVEISIAVSGAMVLEKGIAWFSTQEKKKCEPQKTDPLFLKSSPELVAGVVFLILFLIGGKQEENHLMPLIKSCLPAAFLFFVGYRGCETRRGTDFAVDYALPSILCSFGMRCFPDIVTVGANKLVLCTFAAEVFSMLLNKVIKNDTRRFCCMFVLSVLGMRLGQSGYRLLWDMDIALYLMVYICAGQLCRKYGLLAYAVRNPWVYFVLSPVWAYMIYAGHADIMGRSYGRYGSVIGGALAAVVLVYMLSAYVCNKMELFGSILGWLGRTPITYVAAVVFVGHKFAERHIPSRFDSNGIIFFALVCIMELTVAVFLFRTVWFIGNKVNKCYGKDSE